MRAGATDGAFPARGMTFPAFVVVWLAAGDATALWTALC
jgi:hypothetical protein